MLGFCFLTYDEIVREDVWNEYFKNVPDSKYDIFCHPKCLEKIKTQELFKNKIVPNRVHTSWGTFSLIEAQRMLLIHSLKKKEITHFIILSHNTIPVQSFEKLECFLNGKPSIFDDTELNYVGTTHQQNIYDTLLDPDFPVNMFHKQSQWCILSRDDAQYLVDEHDKITRIFIKSRFSDEHTYINYLIHYKKTCPLLNIRLTYIDWYYNDKKGTTPVIFENISDTMMLGFESSNTFFLRKVSETTNCENVKQNISKSI